MRTPSLDVEMLRKLADGPRWEMTLCWDEMRLAGLAEDGLAVRVSSGELHGRPYRQYEITDAGRDLLAAQP